MELIKIKHMKNILLIFFGLLLSSMTYAQQGDTTATTVQDGIATQDTVVVLSAEDMQAAEKLYNEGVAFYTKGEYAKALSKFNNAIKIKANFPKAYYNLALCHIETANLDSAIEDLNNVIMLQAYDKAYYLRGTVRVDMNELSDAKADFEQAIAIDSSTVRGESYYYLGGIAFENQQYKHAIQNYDSSLNYLPNYAFAFNDRGSANRMLEKYDKAIADYQKALQADPKMAIAYSNMGSVERKKNNLEAAVDDYTKAIEIDPKLVIAYNSRGVVYKDLKEYTKAIADFNKVIELNPDYMYAYNNLGNVKFKMEQYEAAVKDYDKAISLDANYGFAYLNRGIAKEMLRDKEGACADWKQAYKLGVESAKTYISQCE